MEGGRFNGCILAMILVVMGGCRQFPRGMDSVDHSLIPGDDEGAWKSEIALGSTGRTIRAELVIAEAARGAPERLQFIATEADSLILMASWAGMDPKGVLAQNPHLGQGENLAGKPVSLELDPASAARFRALRRVHLARWQQRDEQGGPVVEVVEYVIQKGETLGDLLRRFPTTEDLLARENGYLRLNAIREGQKIRVPLMKSPSS